MSLSGAHMAIRDDLRAALGISRVRKTATFPAPSRDWEVRMSKRVVRILNGVLARRNKKITTVSGRWEDMIRTSGDFSDERGRMSNKTMRFNFCKTE